MGLENYLPEQRCSYKTKLTKKWTMATMDYYIKRCESENSDRIQKITEQYNYINHKISDKLYGDIMGVLQLDLDNEKLKEFRAKKQDYNLILKIVKKYAGEYLTKYSKYQVYNEDGEAVVSRNDLLKAKLNDLLFQMFVNNLNQSGIQTGFESKETPDIETFIKIETNKYIEEKAEKANNRLKLLLQLCDDSYKMMEAVFYYVATDNMIFYVYNDGSDTNYEVVPPEEFYPLNTASSGFVEDNAGCMRKFKMTLSEILYSFDEILTTKQKEELKTVIDRFSDPSYSAGLNMVEYENLFFTYDNTANGSRVEFCDDNMFTDVRHIQYQSYKKVGKLYYVDLMTNSIDFKEVSEEYKLDKVNGDIKIEWEYIPTIYEQYKFGSDELGGVYTEPMELEVQREHLNLKNKIKLSYYGVTNILINAPYTPLPGRLINYQVEYEIVRFKRKQSIAKFKPLMQILPESVLADSDEFTTEQRYSKMLADDTLIINDATLTQNAITALQIGIKNSIENYIKTLGEILNSITQEALDEADMNPARYGNASPYMSGQLAEMQLNYATISNVIALNTYSKARINLYEALIDYSKVAWIDGKIGTIQNAEGNQEAVEVNGIEHYNDNIGIFIKDIVTENQKIEKIKQLADRAAQGSDYEMMIEFINNDDIPTLKKLSRNLKDAENNLKRELEQYKIQAEEIKKQAKQLELDAKLKETVFKEEQQNKRQDSINEVQLIINNANVLAKQLSDANDSNSSDQANEVYNRSLKERKLTLDEEKQKSNERIAYANKN